ncbi:hypothetical protein GJ496_000926 [Pomphorhynchus laevis]|nr:hypothetical protein GJ496_000926 [Pomphorhynchus laevis]
MKYASAPIYSMYKGRFQNRPLLHGNVIADIPSSNELNAYRHSSNTEQYYVQEVNVNGCCYYFPVCIDAGHQLPHPIAGTLSIPVNTLMQYNCNNYERYITPPECDPPPIRPVCSLCSKSNYQSGGLKLREHRKYYDRNQHCDIWNIYRPRNSITIRKKHYNDQSVYSKSNLLPESNCDNGGYVKNTNRNGNKKNYSSNGNYHAYRDDIDNYYDDMYIYRRRKPFSRNNSNHFQKNCLYKNNKTNYNRSYVGRSNLRNHYFDDI